MEWLNYHHLLYFYTVAREGSVLRAAQRLYLTQPTLSTQIHALEKTLGEPLFAREGRRLQLTEAGRIAFRFAEEIFALGQEMREAMKGRPAGKTLELRVGVSDVIPKAVAHALLSPVLLAFPDIKLICREETLDGLIGQLGAHHLDLVVADCPLPQGSSIKAYSHLLGESEILFLAVPKLAARLQKGFPQSLHDQPLLLPGKQSAMRRSLDAWLEDHGLRPRIKGEFDDTALMKVFGSKGHGVIAMPAWVGTEVRRQYQLAVVGRAAELRIRFYALSPERRIKHPAMTLLLERARLALQDPTPKAREKARKPRR